MALPAPQRRAYTSYRPAAQPLTAPRPISQISGFSFTNDDGFSSQPSYPTPQSQRVLLPPGSTTYDLAEFLKSTGPPAQETMGRTNSARKRALEFLRSSRLMSRHSDQQLRRAEPGLLRLPDSVVAKTSMDGKRYLQIAVPSGDLDINEDDITALPSTNMLTVKPTGNDADTPPTEPLGDEVTSTYHSYLQNARLEENRQIRIVSPEPKPPLQSPGVPPRTSSKRSSERPSLGFATPIDDGGVSRPQTGRVDSPNGLSTPVRKDGEPSKRSSVQSERLSTADTVDSTASSGIVMSAQSAQLHRISRPGDYHYPNARKPPTPGPAPTQALPSLPNGHGRMIPTPVGLMSSDLPHRAGSLTLGTNGRAHGHSQSAISRLAHHRNLARASTGSSLRPTAHGAGLTTAPNHDESSSPTSAEDLRNTRSIRERRVRARKMRDIQFMRTGHGTERVDEGLNIQIGAPQEVAPIAESGPSADAPEAPGKPESSWSFERSPSPVSVHSGGSRLSAVLHAVTSDEPAGEAATADCAPNVLSPVMLVADIEPVLPKVDIRIAEGANQQSSMIATALANGMTPPSSARSVSSSSAADSIRPPVSEQTDWSDRRSSANIKAEQRNSRYLHDPLMEARLNALEKKNALLEAALLAVLQTSVNYTSLVPPQGPTGGPSYPGFPGGMPEALLRGS